MKQDLYLYGWILGKNMEHGKNKNIHDIFTTLKGRDVCRSLSDI